MLRSSFELLLTFARADAARIHGIGGLSQQWLAFR
jgi:hypothetical protein